MTKYSFEDKTLALAGVQQAAVLIQQLLADNRCDQTAFEASINSIYLIDAPNVAAVYGGKQGVILGLKQLLQFLSAKSHNSVEQQVARHIFGMLQMERHLSRDAAMRNTLLKKINYAKNQAEFFNSTHPAVIASLSRIYEETIGKFPFKIHIMGRRELLTNSEFMHKIRALLLAGIRSAVLWQQVGGGRWQLIFNRTFYKKAAEDLIKSSK